MELKKKINKKVIINQTISFISIVAFIIGFKAIFGDKNTLIGVTTVTAFLMFKYVNLTSSLLKNFCEITLINVFTGIAAYISSGNMWLAIPINFLVMFIISYKFYYVLRNPLYMPFSLQYLFILANPVSSEELPIRLVALLVAPIGILLYQLLFNRNKLSKVGNKLIANICDNIIKKINYDNNDEEINININKDVNEFRKLIYDNRKDNLRFTEEGRIKLSIVVALEKISILINKKNSNEETQEALSKLAYVLEEVKESFNNEEYIHNIHERINELLKDYKNINFQLLEIINSIEIICYSLDELKKLGKENYNKTNSSKKVHKKYKVINNLKNECAIRTVKFSYVIRVSLGVVIAAFISDYFKLSEGRWIYFTVFVLVIPIYELSKQKIKDRLFATLVGAITLVVLFSIFKDVLSRSIILLISGYIRNYVESYRYSTIFTTIGAVGSAALLGGEVVFSFKRLLYVVIGVIIAMLINKFILHVRMKDANEELESMYKATIEEMLKVLYEDVYNDNYNSNIINNLLLVTSMIEEKLLANNNMVLKQKELDELQEDRILLINIHQLYTILTNKMIEIYNREYILEDLRLLTNYNNIEIKEAINDVEAHIAIEKEVNDKIILANIREIFMNIHNIEA